MEEIGVFREESFDNVKFMNRSIMRSKMGMDKKSLREVGILELPVIRSHHNRRATHEK
jgi:hypothetical protein